MACYLLHFDEPYPAGRRPRHYIGYASNVQRRLKQHQNGTSRARLLEVVKAAGIGFRLARVWPDGDRQLERRLKSWKKGSALCPVCRAEPSSCWWTVRKALKGYTGPVWNASTRGTFRRLAFLAGEGVSRKRLSALASLVSQE